MIQVNVHWYLYEVNVLGMCVHIETEDDPCFVFFEIVLLTSKL